MKDKPISKPRRAFLKTATLALSIGMSLSLSAPGISYAEVGEPEKEDLKFGFIKLTDMAPLAIAYEKGYFEDEGLYVTLEAQANWKVLLDGVIDGQLDGAHMLAGQPLAATIGFGTKAHIITPFSMDLNGNGITVSNDIWEQMKPNVPKMKDGRPQHPIKADYLKPVVDKYKADGKPFKMGMVFPVSTHNYELRYWLAAGGINPGYYAPAKDNPEKVFGMTKEFTEKYPNTSVRVVKAMLRAAMWLDADNNANRPEAVKYLSQPNYVGADYDVIANSMTGTFEYEKGDKREVPDFNVFFRYNATYPYYSDAIWYLSQMRRWGQIAEYKPDSWYFETAKKVYRPDIYEKAAKELIAEGKMTAADFPDFASEDGFREPQTEFIDGITYDGKKPNAYLESLAIGLKNKDKI